MRYRIPLVSLALLAGASGMAQLRWLNGQIRDRIQITGYRQLGYHSHQVDGDRDAFNSLTYYGQGNRRFTDTGQITLSGRDVLGLFTFDATFTDNRFRDPQNERFTLGFRKSGWNVQAGDIIGSLLNTNTFASMNNSLRGASVQYNQGRFAAKVLYTDTKASSRTVSLQGINSAGPYYLSSSQVIRGSEQVLLDGQLMELQRDYTINYEIGSITFVNRIIPPTSTILVTYEALDFNSSTGTIQGLGASYDFGKFGRFGFTTIEQTSRNRSGLSSRVEQFEGFGAASTPYFLQFEPLNSAAFPTRIRVDGILQVEGVDYRFDANNKSIFYFNRFMPSTSIIEVVYFPRPTSVAEGDRRVVGVDYRVPLGKPGSYLSYSQALGKMSSPVTPLQGTARGVQGVYKEGPWTLNGSWRDVPDGFVGVTSRGFNRNEKATNVNVEYEAKGFGYGAAHRNSSVSTRTTNPDGTLTFGKGRQTNATAYARYGSDRWQWNLEQSRRTNATGRNDSQIDTTSFFASQKLPKFDLRYGFDHQAGRSTTASGVSLLNLDTIRFDGDYTATSAWRFGWRTALSRIKFDNQQGDGRDVTLTANYRPNPQWSVEAAYSDSDSGQLAALNGFQGEIGYDDNGFVSGLPGGGFTAGSTQFKYWNIRSRYESGARLAVDLRASNYRSSGSLYSNTETTTLAAGLDYDLGAGNSVSVSLDQTRTRFLDSPNRSDTRSLSVSLNGRPPGPWSYRLGANTILSGGTSAFAQDSQSLEGFLAYKIDDRQSAYLQFNTGRTTGYLPQAQTFFGVFYEYRLWQNVALIGSYKWRRVNNLDPLFTSGAYRSRGFDLELSFSFGR